MKEIKCNVCGNPNSEQKVIKLKVNFVKRLFGAGKLTICQTCVSKMFRGLDPQK
jgi:hypothetical protein